MNIFGLQKLTLIDYPEKVAATIFLGGCNFRCPFCHNGSLVTGIDWSAAMDTGSVLDFLRNRAGILDGVCISGGEPLMSSGLEDFIKQIKDMGYSVKLDTNGSFPDGLVRLAEQKLVDYVAMDIKNSLEKYGLTIGISNFETTAVEKSADFLMNGSLPFEFRTTVVKEFHTAEDFDRIGRRFGGAERYYLQSFQESDGVIQKGLHACTKTEMKNFRNILAKYVPNAALRYI